MDKYVVPNFNRREGLSSFSEVDAGYIDNAARALKKAGDVVIVEAQHRSLRDHYVKQILAQLLALYPHILVNRCKKDRDWMVAALNQAFEKNKVSEDKSKAGHLKEVWILELSSPEDFGILKLAQTLVSHFKEAGSCVLVSCSPSVTNLREFTRWSNRIEIPVWHFEVPDSLAINAFLEQEAQNGAINQARKLVDELQFSDGVNEGEVGDSAPEYPSGISSKEIAMNTSPADALKISGLVIPIKEKSEIIRANKETQSKEKSQELINSKSVGQPGSGYRKRAPGWGSVRMAAFGFLIILLAASAVFFISNNGTSVSNYQDYIEGGATKLSLYFSSSNEDDLANPIAAIEEVDVGTQSDNEKSLVEPKGEKSEVIETQDLSSDRGLSDSPGVSRSEVSKLGLQSKFEQTRPLLSGAAVAGDRKSMDYFAQFGAFENRNSALWYKINQGEDFSDALIVTKPSGLWAVVTGPFGSKELAKASMEGREADIYVISASEIILN